MACSIMLHHQVIFYSEHHLIILFLLDLLKSQRVRFLSLSICSVFVLFRFRFYGILKFWENFTVKCFYGLKAIHQNSEADLGAWTAICFFWLRSRQMVQVGLCTLLTLDKWCCTLLTLDKSAIFTVISKDSRCVQSKFLY